MNLALLLHRAGRIAAGRVALMEPQHPIATYGEMSAAAARLAGGMIGAGVQPGGRVVLFAGNCHEYLTCLFACWHAGLIVVPVNAKLHERELAFIVADTGCALCIASRDLAETAARAIDLSQADARLVVFGEASFRVLERHDPVRAAEVAPDDIAWLFYTSGTTGRPKGAMLTHRNLLAMTLALIADVEHPSAQDAIIHAAPLSHASGLCVLPFVAGLATHVVPDCGTLNAAQTLELLAQHANGCLFASPTMLNRLVAEQRRLSRDVSKIKTIITGGAPLYMEDCRAALDTFGPVIAQIYGQGETPMTITTLPKSFYADSRSPKFWSRLATVGYPHAIVEVRTGDGEASEPKNEPAEILVRGATVMKGYWRNPEASEIALQGGWLRTGDIGYFDSEGLLVLSGRSKEVIISGGHNVYPKEIEDVLLQHPAVAEAVVFGRGSREWGEEVFAVIVPRPDVELTAADLDRHCLSNLARFKRPKGYAFAEAIPKNTYGKVLKSQLRERYGETRVC